MKKIICMSQGSELLLNKELYERYQKQYEFIDGNLQYTTAIIKNNKGQLFVAYNKKHKSRQIPAGKIDLGESSENGLKREMKEELGIEITNMNYLGNMKVFLNGFSRQGYFFNINDYQGQIQNMESEKHNNGIRIDIVKSDNLLGFYIKIGDKIIDDIDLLLYKRRGIIGYQNFILNSKYNNISQNFDINLSKIEKNKEYIQYLDTDIEQFGILEKSQFFSFL